MSGNNLCSFGHVPVAVNASISVRKKWAQGNNGVQPSTMQLERVHILNDVTSCRVSVMGKLISLQKEKQWLLLFFRTVLKALGPTESLFINNKGLS